jgi:hypothetical protein
MPSQNFKNRLSMGLICVLNILLVVLSNLIIDASKDLCPMVVEKASILLTISSIGLGASALCLVSPDGTCSGHQINVGLLFALTVTSLVFASMILYKCKDNKVKLYCGLIIAITCLLIAGLAFYIANSKGLVTLAMDKLRSKNETPQLPTVPQLPPVPQLPYSPPSP